MTQGLEARNLPRAVPQLDLDTEAFWTGGREGKLLIHRCGDCGYYVHPPTSFCPSCESRSVTPEPVSGRGTILSMTVSHKQWLPGLQVPYIVAMVAIEEQDDVHLITNIEGAPIESVSIGDKVKEYFEQAQDVWVPLFRLAEA